MFEFEASKSGSHPKWLLTWKYQVSYPFPFYKTAFQNILPRLNILSSHFYWNWIAFSRKNEAEKNPIFFLRFAHFWPKSLFFRIWLLFLYGLLFKSKAFLSKMLLIFKTCKELNYNSYLAHNSVSFFVDFRFENKYEADILSANEEVFKL